MPYLSPSHSPSTSTTTPPADIPTPEPPKYTTPTIHRRIRSATPSFSDEKGPGAFAPLGRLPRRQRQDKKPLFEIAPDDNENDYHDPFDVSPPLTPPIPATTRPPPPVLVTSAVSPPTLPAVSNIPFPTSSPVNDHHPPNTLFLFPSLRSSTPSESRSPLASGISRTPSTPVVLSNGKPLKSSLKSSVSSPAIGQLPAHTRSRSEPPTPSVKSVHFADSDLESVVVFEKTARPRAVSGGAEDTETETEGYDSPSAYPFPKTSDPFSIDLDPAQSSSVPFPDPTPGANVYLETILFPRSRPPTLRGSVLVKNVAFEKLVALRFTLDNWQTTSEVTCKYVCSLPALPPPFPPEREAVGTPKVGWDRFSFLIRLEDVERKLVERTIFLVTRFTATGVGEWWDNNNDKNYRLRFKHITPAPAKGPSPLRQSNKRSLDLDFDTGPPLPVVRKQNPPTFFSNADLPPPPPAPHAVGLSNLTLTRPRSASGDSFGTSSSLGSLRLSNYVPPTSPPMTPRTSTVGSRPPLPTFGPIVGGQPISAPASPSNSVDTTHAAGMDTTDTYATLVEKWCFHQSSPTSHTPQPSDAWRSSLDGAPYGSVYSYGHHQTPSQVVG